MIFLLSPFTVNAGPPVFSRSSKQDNYHFIPAPGAGFLPGTMGSGRKADRVLVEL